MSISPWAPRHLSMTARICSSDWTSQGSTNVEPIDSASGRTRRSMRLSIDEKPTTAPSSWSALAIPQAIEWSLATPKTSARLPSTRPIRAPFRAGPHRLGRVGQRPETTIAGMPDDLRTTLAGVRAFVLDADGVLLYRGRPIDGSVAALETLQARGIPYRVVTNYSSVHRTTLAEQFSGLTGL